MSSYTAVTYSTELPSASRARYWCPKKASSVPPIDVLTLASTLAHAMLKIGCVPVSSLAMAYSVGRSEIGSGGAHFLVTTLATLRLDTSLHTHLAIGICTKMSSVSRSIPSPSSAPAAHWWYSRLAHGFSTPNMTLIPPHASRIRLVTVAENSSCRSYRSAQNSETAPPSVMSVSGSRNRLSRSSATVEKTLYENRLQASTPAPGLDIPITIRAPSPAVPACTVAHTCCCFF